MEPIGRAGAGRVGLHAAVRAPGARSRGTHSQFLVFCSARDTQTGGQLRLFCSNRFMVGRGDADPPHPMHAQRREIRDVVEVLDIYGSRTGVMSGA
jgi:hypothetical protein